MNATSVQPKSPRQSLVRTALNNSRRTERWAIILAGGDGTRLQSMTRTITGDNRPKQFVSGSDQVARCSIGAAKPNDVCSHGKASALL